MTERDEIDAIVKNLDDFLDRHGGCVIVSTWAARMLEKYHPEGADTLGYELAIRNQAGDKCD